MCPGKVQKLLHQQLDGEAKPCSELLLDEVDGVICSPKIEVVGTCSTSLRSNHIGGSKPVLGCSFNSFYLPFY